MAANEVAICVDAGTTVIKTVVFDMDGRELAVTRRETTVRHPSRERCEQDMLEVWDAVVATVGEAVARVARPVRLLAVTAQGDGAWLVGPDGRPAGPAVLWNDGRATDVVRDWRADGTLERAYRINGSLTNAGLPNAILRSQHRDEPCTVLTCGGWLRILAREENRSPLLIQRLQLEWLFRLVTDPRRTARRYIHGIATLAMLCSRAALRRALD